MNKEKFQIIYMMIFIISSLGIAGNMELGVESPKWLLISFGVSGVLSICKIGYWIKKRRLF